MSYTAICAGIREAANRLRRRWSGGPLDHAERFTRELDDLTDEEVARIATIVYRYSQERASGIKSSDDLDDR